MRTPKVLHDKREFALIPVGAITDTASGLLSFNERKVLDCLYLHLKRGGSSVRIKRETIKKWTGLRPDQISKITKSLELKSWLLKPLANGGRSRPNEYIMRELTATETHTGKHIASKKETQNVSGLCASDTVADDCTERGHESCRLLKRRHVSCEKETRFMSGHSTDIKHNEEALTGEGLDEDLSVLFAGMIADQYEAESSVSSEEAFDPTNLEDVPF